MNTIRRKKMIDWFFFGYNVLIFLIAILILVWNGIWGGFQFNILIEYLIIVGFTGVGFVIWKNERLS